jgi:ABC-type enterobactin transport system permease subunit
MIELLGDLYRFILSGISIGFVVAAFFVWYCIHRDMKEREAFDEKYRKSRDLKDKEWKR